MRKTSAAAVTAMVAAALALVPVGVVFGIVALFRIPRRNQRGKRLAITALSVCAVWTLLAMVGVIGAAAYVGTRHGELTAMRTGVCYDEPDNGTGQVDVVDCATAHDAQIIARPKLNGGHGDFPGADATMRQSVVDCARSVAAAVPDPGALPQDVVFYAYPPTRADWNHDIRDSVCILAGADMQRWTGDARDASGYSDAQLALLRPTAESVLLRQKLGALPEEKWQAGAALAAELVTVDRSTADLLGSAGAGNASVRDAAAALARAERAEAPLAQPLADAGDVDAWDSALRTFVALSATSDRYTDLRTALGL